MLMKGNNSDRFIHGSSSKHPRYMCVKGQAGHSGIVSGEGKYLAG